MKKKRCLNVNIGAITASASFDNIKYPYTYCIHYIAYTVNNYDDETDRQFMLDVAVNELEILNNYIA